MLIYKEKIKQAIKEKVNAEDLPNSLSNDLFYMVDNDIECYVFDKYFKGEVPEDVHYYKYSGKESVDEDGYENFHEYNQYFMEIHGIYNMDDYAERVVIYANNNCVRDCCGTWEILNLIISEK